MSSPLADLCKRILVAGESGLCTPGLAREMLDALDRLTGRGRLVRCERRDQILRQAAALISGSKKARAKALNRAIAALECGESPADEFGRLVQQSLEVDRYGKPPGLRQIERILSRDI